MSKKKILIIIISLVAVLAIAGVIYFLVSSKVNIDGAETSVSLDDLYVYDENGEIETDPVTGYKYVYETDEEGNLVYNDGELQTQYEGYEYYQEFVEESSTFPLASIIDEGESMVESRSGSESEPKPMPSEPSGDVIGEITLER